MQPQQVTVIGAGYVGLNTSISLAYLGHRVCCFDVDADKIASLRIALLRSEENIWLFSCLPSLVTL